MDSVKEQGWWWPSSWVRPSVRNPYSAANMERRIERIQSAREAHIAEQTEYARSRVGGRGAMAWDERRLRKML